MTQPEITMPPQGTSCGYRQEDGSMWVACNPEPDKKPGIAFCDHPGNWVNPALYKLVAVFENEADRDFVLSLHKIAVTKGLQ
jgi:hypothetical protein